MIVKFQDFILENIIWINKHAKDIILGGEEKIKEEIIDIFQDIIDDFGIDAIDIDKNLEEGHADFDINIYYGIMNTREMNNSKKREEIYLKLMNLRYTLENEGYVDQIEGRLGDIGLKLLQTRFKKLNTTNMGFIQFKVMKMSNTKST